MRVAVLAVLVLAVPAAAQSRPADAPADAPCTYDACALRVEPNLFSRDLLQGVDGVRVGRLGLFGSDLEGAVLGSDYAEDQARTFARTRSVALVAGIASAALFVLSVPDGPLGRSEGAQSAAGLGGLVLGIVGIRFQLQSEQALSRAVWEFNRTLADAPDAP